MYPHERSLVKDLANEPFAIVGVNSDPDLAKLRPRLSEESITWRSFWDESTSGPIATQWNVNGWPTIYVLDHAGVIRYRGVQGEHLDAAIRELLAKIE
jgi:hypothetical protein